MRLKMNLVIGMCAMSLSGYVAATTPPEPASMVFTSGNVLTMDAKRTVAEAVAIRGNKIVAIGSDQEVKSYIGTGTKVIHLNGKTLLPGFIDAHIHPVDGAIRLGKCSADDVAQPVAQIVAKVLKECMGKEAGASAAANKWIEVVNVNPSNFIATTADLDKISRTRPVIFEGTDGHTSWVNSVALKLAKITADTPNPAGGQIERDAKGQATGFLKDEAQGSVMAVMPKMALAQRIKLSQQAFALIRSKGITSVQDAWTSPDEMEVYEALEKSQQLNLRVRATLKSTIADDEAEYQRLAAIRSHFVGHPLIRADAVKIFSDGVIEYPTQTAAMIEPYLDGKGVPTTNYGGRYFAQDTLNKYVARLDKDGFTVHVHSIGDFTTHAALDAFQYARDKNGVNDNRHQITHLQIVDPADYPRFAKLNVYADMQLYWADPEEYSVGAVQPYISAERFDHMYPAGSLKKAGAVIVGCSDWPVDAAPGDPMPNTPLSAMQMAITRQNSNSSSSYFGKVLNADERVDIDTMLAAYTINAAKAMQQDNTTGSIEVGKLADLVVLGQNPMTIAPEKLSAIPVQYTIFDGAILYQLKPGAVATAH
ncbi:amidohydrolase [Solimicrobium silvestre]|uniref:Putative metal-dependent hydrolase with the TIM-barrel fold n=1 Tax=Solimicrobium silvestre TaxID=2099400 RepID=A0A2S9H3N3_9BURK|nr:amidohydrolase [Solimicrobium silvestre]PRC94571.1 putative metal-dependent hydrolase with the TIM-barrel fold [Solimicrobium silvestre]